MRVLLADDHPVVREGLKAILSAERDLTVVACEADGERAIEAVRRLKPDVAVLDIQMPGMSGLEAARRLQQEKCGTHVVILSLHKDELDVQSAVSAGVSGYVVKDDAAAELVGAIRAAVRGDFYFSPRLSASVVQALRHGRTPTADQLTSRERDVLQLLAAGLRSKEIASRLELSPKTVEGHRSSLMDKLEVRSIAGLVKYALRHRLAEL